MNFAQHAITRAMRDICSRHRATAECSALAAWFVHMFRETLVQTWYESLIVVALLGLLTACELQEPVAVESTSGALGLQCDSGGIEVGEVDYTIARGAQVIHSGTFAIGTEGPRFSTTIGPLPSGTDYSITMHARALRLDSGESSDCLGEGNFSVAPRQTTAVAIQLSCGGVRERGLNANSCPLIDSVRAQPSEARVGSSMVLSAEAHDNDRGRAPLTFSWTSHDGLVTQSNQQSARFTCMVPGRPAITVQVSDGDDTCPEESVTLIVTCKPPRAQACPAASGHAGQGTVGMNGAAGAAPHGPCGVAKGTSKWP